MLCCLEVNNVLRLFEKKGYISGLDVEKTVASIDGLQILFDYSPLSFVMPLVLGLARKHDLTIYDASYLELAVRLRLPLATLDKALIEAIKAEGLAIKKT
jgi:predicted nucleic acid-binding protein